MSAPDYPDDAYYEQGRSVLLTHGIDIHQTVIAVANYIGIPDSEAQTAADATMALAADWEDVPVEHTADALAPWLCDNRGGHTKWAEANGTIRADWRFLAERTLTLWKLIGLDSLEVSA